MKSNQKLSLLFWLKKSKANKKTGRAPLYARITIDSDEEEISLSRTVLPEIWDVLNKQDLEQTIDAKATNLKISNAEETLEAHFKVLCLQHSNVTALMLKNVYNGLPAEQPRVVIKHELKSQMTLIAAFDNFVAEFQRMVDKVFRYGSFS